MKYDYKKLMKESVMLGKWMKEVSKILRKTYPNASKKSIDKYIEKLIEDHYKDEQVVMYNNYEETTKYSTMSSIENFYFSPIKPIATEHGTFFRRGPKSPAALMLAEEKEERSAFKKQMFACDPDSEEFEYFNLLQLLKKIAMNSYYGASGAPSCIFFNLHCATATTGKGQAIISTATQTFEAFLTNNCCFLSDNDAFIFIKNCIEEAKEYDITRYVDNIPTVEQVLEKVVNTYEYPRLCKRESKEALFNYIKYADANERCMIYYKNNLYTFISHCHEVKDLIASIITSGIKFVDSNEVPEELQDRLDDMWAILNKAVNYKHMPMDRVYRLKNKRRKSVMIIDTDSNMINMKPWTDFTIGKILKNDLRGLDFNDVRYSTLSTISYILGKVISGQFYMQMKFSNVEKEDRKLLKMKNEFLYKRMLISSGKKNYVGVVEYKEGKFMDFKLDVKGLPINKISSNAEASDFFKNLVKDDILKSDNIDIPSILRKLQEFQDNMIDSLRRGEKTYLKPNKVKEERYYDNPLSQQPFRASIHWNILNSDIEIEAPDSISVIKLKCSKLSDLDAIKDSHPDMYEKVKREIFESDIDDFRKKGLYVIAIPRHLERVPEWIIPFIDIDTIVHDNMKNIVTILKSLELMPIASSASEGHFGNIVKL